MILIKRNLVASMVICSFSLLTAPMASAVGADMPVQVHPARVETMKPMPDVSKVQIKPVESPVKPDLKKNTKTISTKIQYTKYRKFKKAAPKRIVINYSDIDRMIEYGNYDGAERIIRTAMKQNSHDVRANVFEVISLAKQNKLDSAQNKADKLFKLYPKNADLHYAQGLIYYKRTTSSNMVYINNTQKLLDDANKEFNKAYTLDKNNAKAYNAAGVVALNQGKNSVAKDFFKRAIAADKTYSTAIDNLGTMDFSESKFDDAEKKFKQALAYNSSNATAMYHLAQVSTIKQNFPQALNYLSGAIALNPNTPAFYNLLGEVYQNQGNEPAAINAFKKSIAVKPEFAQAYINLAELYEKRGDNEFAIEQLKTILSINPDFYDAKLKIADLSLGSGKYDQAIENYSALVGVKDYNDNALKGLANAYYDKAQVSSTKALIGSNQDLYAALDSINKAIIANSDDLELHLAKLKLAKITNQPEVSETTLKEITQSPDGNLVKTVIKGEAYLTLNDYAQAKETFDQAAASTRNVQEDLYLSEIFIYHRQYENAKNVLQNVLKKEPDNQQAICDLDYIQKSEKTANNYFKSAEFYLKTKNTNAAMEYLSRSLSLNPNNADAHLLLAELYEKQKDNKGAVANYKAYLGLETKANNKPNIEKKIIRLEKF